MLARLSAIEYVRPMTAGRSGPLLLICESREGKTTEVVAKISSGCEEGVVSLAREALGACLAGDLGLPIPRPYIIEITPGGACSFTASDGRRGKGSNLLPLPCAGSALPMSYAPNETGRSGRSCL